MKLSTTGSKHDEAGCMMIIVWIISSGIIMNCINKFNVFIKIFGGMFCFLLLIVGIYLVAKEYPKGEK